MFGLVGKKILVTGASGGIGAATVRQLVKSGADVYAGGRDEKKLKDLSAEAGCTVLSFDLTSEESVRDAVLGRDCGVSLIVRGLGRDRHSNVHGHRSFRQGDRH
ncbi:MULTISPECIES: SDR family oxidoreductase [Agrobacterium]|uniref:SDR family oxidoreductase n=1 Tax=Agrobacterium TaxID=357 RepID=UPI00228594AA|nr:MULTISPECIES: SDR family NAD(P)-dependent oxidoreductase [Agrobacterium]